VLTDLIARKRLAGILLALSLAATGVACEGEVDVDSGENGGENGGEEGGGIDVEGEVGEGGEGEGEGGE
jgi:hypothetical protein